ncbi:MAG: class A beta-lactamase-related serine hydrolase [Eudoraea sp.]|nr:class A beta-lactamase-related serine hydrolase [Eudoraea sp.]MBT8293280.1 class A beta-lactamase-related serine hydrolase [Eudoraea sp.]
MKTLKLTFFILFLVSLSCATKSAETNPMERVLKSQNLSIRRVLDSIDQYEVQILYTQIDHNRDSLILTDYEFQLDERNYFYPASTVKLPIAVLALEKLNLTDTLNRNTRYYIEGDSVENTFAEDISKILSVSDNHANNRLLEYQGQDDINKRLETKGITPVRISHRLGIHSDDLTTKPLILYMNDSTTGISESIINSEPLPLNLNGIKKGIGYYKNDSLHSEPFDFSLKNYYPVNSQHQVLKRIIFPELFDNTQSFNISKDQREFLLKAMHTLPKDAGYDPEEYYDGYCKFFMYGDSEENIPEHIKIYNKVGFAYGTLTDCAYIVDEKNQIEFMLTATILVNKDGVFNDDKYEYDEIGIPFLAALGREFYKFEINRKK